MVYSLNHDITVSFTLDSDPELPKLGGGMAGLLTKKLTYILQIAHENTSNGSIGKMQHLVGVSSTIAGRLYGVKSESLVSH